MDGNWQIDFAGPTPKVTVDGAQLPVAQVQVHHRQGEYPRVYVVLDANSVNGSGFGDIEVDNGLTPLAFLESIDVAALEEAVYAEPSMTQNPTEQMIEALKELARHAES